MHFNERIALSGHELKVGIKQGAVPITLISAMLALIPSCFYHLGDTIRGATFPGHQMLICFYSLRRRLAFHPRFLLPPTISFHNLAAPIPNVSRIPIG